MASGEHFRFAFSPPGHRGGQACDHACPALHGSWPVPAAHPGKTSRPGHRARTGKNERGRLNIGAGCRSIIRQTVRPGPAGVPVEVLGVDCGPAPWNTDGGAAAKPRSRPLFGRDSTSTLPSIIDHHYQRLLRDLAAAEQHDASQGDTSPQSAPPKTQSATPKTRSANSFQAIGISDKNVWRRVWSGRRPELGEALAKEVGSARKGGCEEVSGSGHCSCQRGMGLRRSE